MFRSFVRMRECAIVLASAWICAVAFCTAVQALCNCRPWYQNYVSPYNFQLPSQHVQSAKSRLARKMQAMLKNAGA